MVYIFREINFFDEINLNQANFSDKLHQPELVNTKK